MSPRASVSLPEVPQLVGGGAGSQIRAPQKETATLDPIRSSEEAPARHRCAVFPLSEEGTVCKSRLVPWAEEERICKGLRTGRVEKRGRHFSRDPGLAVLT